MTESRVQTVAVDFDKTLHTYDKGWHDGTIYGDWMPGAVGALSQLMNKYAVFVHTTRNPGQVARWIERKSSYGFECVTHVSPWPWRWGGTFWNTQGVLLVTNRKLAAVAYIDDRAVRFTDWDQALTDVGITPIARLGGEAE